MNISPLKKLLHYCAVFISITVVFVMFIKEPGIEGYYTVRIHDMVYGTAYKPFVTRVLVPWTVRALCISAPEVIKARSREFAKANNFAMQVFEKLKFTPDYAPEYLIIMIIMYLFLAAYYGVLINLARHFLNISLAGCRVTALAGIWMLPLGFKIHSHIYDFAQLFLFALCLLLMAKARWRYYLVVFLFACLNKETSLLLPLIFLIHYREQIKTARTTYVHLLIIQAAIYTVVRSVLIILYAGNPGGIVEYHLAHNIGLIKPFAIEQIFSAAAVIFLIFYRWIEKPAFLKDCLWISIPLVSLTSFYGMLDETRDFYELFPIIILLCGDTVIRFFRIQVHSEADRDRIRHLAAGKEIQGSDCN